MSSRMTESSLQWSIGSLESLKSLLDIPVTLVVMCSKEKLCCFLISWLMMTFIALDLYTVRAAFSICTRKNATARRYSLSQFRLAETGISSHPWHPLCSRTTHSSTPRRCSKVRTHVAIFRQGVHCGPSACESLVASRILGPLCLDLLSSLNATHPSL